MITLKAKGSFKNTEHFLERMSKGQIFDVLTTYGERGVSALSAATPERTGASAASWYFEVEQKRGIHKIIFSNSNLTSQGVPIVILIQYGHGTGTGGYVPSINFINPVIDPLFDDILNDVWKEVTK